MRYYVEDSDSEEWDFVVIDTECCDEPVAAFNDETIADIFANHLNFLDE